MRLIDADALKESIGECPMNWTDSPEELESFNAWHRVMDDIDSAPTVDKPVDEPVDEPQGQLTGCVSVKDRLPNKPTVHHGEYVTYFRCAVCNQPLSDEWCYCPRCGERIDWSEPTEEETNNAGNHQAQL